MNLQRATAKGDKSAFNTLIRSGTAIDSRPTTDHQSAIHKAGNVEMLKLILECGANVSIKDSNGWSAIHHYAFKGEVENLKLLVK